MDDNLAYFSLMTLLKSNLLPTNKKQNKNVQKFNKTLGTYGAENWIQRTSDEKALHT